MEDKSDSRPKRDGVRCGNAVTLWPGREKWKLPEGVIHEKTLLWLQRQETQGQRRQNALRVWNRTWSRAGVGTEGGWPAGRPVPTWRIPTTRAFQGNAAAEPSEHGCFVLSFYPQGNGGLAQQIRNAFRTKFNYTYLFLPFVYFLYLTMKANKNCIYEIYTEKCKMKWDNKIINWIHKKQDMPLETTELLLSNYLLQRTVWLL